MILARKVFPIIPILCHDKTDTLNSLHKNKRGRPKKDVDIGVMFHMLKNDAPVTAIARHLGIHRDTLYVNYAQIINAGREAMLKAWREAIAPWLEECARKRRLKQLKLEARLARAKRRYRRRRYY
jgi:hypothetical protein